MPRDSESQRPSGSPRNHVHPGLGCHCCPRVAATATEILERFTQPPQVNEADRPPVDLVATLQSGNASRDSWPPPHEAMPTGQAATGRTSAFDRLGHRTPTSQEESKWVPHPEMTPRKIECGWQPHKEPRN